VKSTSSSGWKILAISTISTIGHRDRGGLSTVMAFVASREPKNIAFQDCAPAWTAAA
jgi:hypothetical protein